LWLLEMGKHETGHTKKQRNNQKQMPFSDDVSAFQSEQ